VKEQSFLFYASCKMGVDFRRRKIQLCSMHPANFTRMMLSARPGFLLIALGAATSTVFAQTTNPVPVLQIKADQVAAKVSPMLYGLMTEEINFSYEGGLYGELIRNRTFKANRTNAVFWSAVGNAVISLDTNQPLNSALNERGFKKFAGRHRQRRLLGNRRPAGYDLSCVVLRQGGQWFQRAADREPRKHQRQKSCARKHFRADR